MWADRIYFPEEVGMCLLVNLSCSRGTNEADLKKKISNLFTLYP